MKYFTLKLRLVFLVLFGLFTMYGDANAQSTTRPDPMVTNPKIIDSIPYLGSSVKLSFNFGNFSTLPIPSTIPGELNLTMNKIKLTGAFNPANITGTAAQYFTWTYLSTFNMIVGTQNQNVPANFSGNIIISGLYVSDTSGVGNERIGFNLNTDYIGSYNSLLSNDYIEVFTSNKNTILAKNDVNSTLMNLPVSGNVLTNDEDHELHTITLNTTPILAPANGTVVINANGAYTYTPAVGFVGQDKFSYKICDNGKPVACDSATVYIDVLPKLPPTNINDNLPPVAVNDANLGKVNLPVKGNVLSNDFDLDGNTITLNTTPVSNPKNGTIAFNTNGSYVYTPNSNFLGKDTVAYAICDNGVPSKCDTGYVFINILPETGNVTVANDDISSALKNKVQTGDLLKNDYDPESNTQTINTVPKSSTVHGTLVINSNGTFTYTPNKDFIGTDQFVYEVCDNGTPPACDQATVYIDVLPVNELNPDFNVTDVNVQVTGNMQTNDVLPQGGTFGTPIASVGNPNSSLPVINPNGTYTFSSPLPGEYNFSVPVCPKNQTTNCPIELLTITVLNPLDAASYPVANTDISATKVNVPVIIDVKSNDKASNPNGVLGTPSAKGAPAHGSVTYNSNGTATYTPVAGYVGLDSFSYTICDISLTPAKCDTALVIVTIKPADVPNTTSASDDYAYTTDNAPVSGNVKNNDSDPEGNTQTVTAQTTTVPKGTLVLNSNGTYTFTPTPGFAGPVEFVYTTCDNGTPSVCAKATLHILVELSKYLIPDFNVTNVNVPVTGNMMTNDILPQGGNFGTPVANAGNPNSSLPTMNSNGTYSFVSSVPGEYNFLVPVCQIGQVSGCPNELLTITVLNPMDTSSAPIANTDVAATKQDVSVRIDVRSNDDATTFNGSLENPTAKSAPLHGTATYNLDGTVTYLPNPGFTGIDTFSYTVCDSSLHPKKCDTALVIVYVKPTSAVNSINAFDDYAFTNGVTPVTGNLLRNDTDPEKNNMFATADTINNTQGQLIILSNGDFIFKANPGVYGPVDYIYNVCDDGTPVACDQATLHILVNDIPNLTPVVKIYPGIITGSDSAIAVVNVYNIGSVPTVGSVKVLVGKSSANTISFNPTLTSASGNVLQNAVWTLDVTSNPFFYVFTTNKIFMGLGSKFSFGYRIHVVNPQSNGNVNASVLVSQVALEENLTDNSDNATLKYFIY